MERILQQSKEEKKKEKSTAIAVHKKITMDRQGKCTGSEKKL
ncbi:hypothetical protein XIS1_1310034 [Xenorhabdus innexi]|uniref:Uncharacterized protein n=1 Tax=Xenorhabdus innexi TaxID=290109 RepID=A0A1N6MT66_9GAMM|nr:hypothetical protein XIS1_1310034 [Xenorhabdus innexi]